MKKILYWMRKIGILQASKPKVVKGSEELNKMQASNYDMMQSQKEIDEKYKSKNIKK